MDVRQQSENQPDSRREVTLLVVDNDSGVARALGRTLGDEAVVVSIAEGRHQAERCLREGAFEALILGLDDEDGCELLHQVREKTGLKDVLIHTASLSGPVARKAREFDLGEVYEKPIPIRLLMDWVERVRGRSQDNGAFGSREEEDWGASRLWGQSRQISALRKQIQRLASSSIMPVLITGEVGTGKKLVARAIHEHTTPHAPFVIIDCARTREETFESEVFGLAGTGSKGQTQVGILEQAGVGTVLFENVGDLPPAIQPKLLRVLETRRFRVEGSDVEIPLRARIVSATSVPLEERARVFRHDLFLRMAGYNLQTTPLRERPEDIPILATRLLSMFCKSYGRQPLSFQPAALRRLSAHPWPGNVRELRGVLEKASVSTGGPEISEETILRALQPKAYETTPPRAPSVYPAVTIPPDPRPVLGQDLVGQGRPFPTLQDLERHVIVHAFQEADGNLSQAARTLGLPRSTLRDRLKRFGITADSK